MSLGGSKSGGAAPSNLDLTPLRVETGAAKTAAEAARAAAEGNAIDTAAGRLAAEDTQAKVEALAAEVASMKAIITNLDAYLRGQIGTGGGTTPVSPPASPPASPPPPAAVAPTLGTALSVTGSREVGSTLTGNDGAWGGTAPIAYERFWEVRDNAADTTVERAANGSTLTLTSAFAGKQVQYVVVASNPATSGGAGVRAETGWLSIAAATTQSPAQTLPWDDVTGLQLLYSTEVLRTDYLGAPSSAAGILDQSGRGQDGSMSNYPPIFAAEVAELDARPALTANGGYGGADNPTRGFRSPNGAIPASDTIAIAWLGTIDSYTTNGYGALFGLRPDADATFWDSSANGVAITTLDRPSDGLVLARGGADQYRPNNPRLIDKYKVPLDKKYAILYVGTRAGRKLYINGALVASDNYPGATYASSSLQVMYNDRSGTDWTFPFSGKVVTVAVSTDTADANVTRMLAALAAPKAPKVVRTLEQPVAQTPAAARSNITAVQHGNAGAASSTGAVVQRVIGFARGEVPGAKTGEVRLTLDGDASKIQTDGETYYNDGCLKAAVVTTLCGTVAAGATSAGLNIGSELGAPRRTGAGILGIGEVTGQDFKLRLRMHPSGEVFEVSVNDVAANGSAFPWGTSPTKGWRQTARGPLRSGWDFWGMAKRVSDGALHKWLKVHVWVDAFGGGKFSLRAKVKQSLAFGAHPAGTVGDALQAPHVFTAELLNGSTVVYRWGGPNDQRVRSIPVSAFDPSTQVITDPSYFCPTGAPFLLAAAPGGTLPPGLSTTEAVWTNWGENGRLRLATSRGAAVGFWFSGAWKANESRDYDEYFSGVAISTNGVGWMTRGQYADTNSHGTSGSNPPAGASPFQDNEITWTRVSSGPFTAGGSGSVQFIPLLATHAFNAVDLVDLDTADRIYVGMSRPQVVLLPDLTHQAHKANLIPPYAPDYEQDPLVNYSKPWPGGLDRLPIDLNATGSGSGDERIGYINPTAARALMRPLDQKQRIDALDMANGFSDYTIYMEDHVSGLVPTANNGPDRQGTPYPNLPLRPGLRSFPYCEGGAVRQAQGVAYYAGYQERYGRPLDSSHLPKPAYGAYVLTGDDAYLDQLVNEWTMNTNSEFGPSNEKVVKGVTYYRVQAAHAGQSGRSVGWATSLLGAVNHLLPETRPERAYVTDVYLDNARYAAAVYKTFTPQRRALGQYTGQLDETQLWMEDFAFWAFSMEALRGEHAGWRDVIENHMAHFVIGRMDPTVGGCAYLSSLRYVHCNDPAAYTYTPLYNPDGTPQTNPDGSQRTQLNRNATETNFISDWPTIFKNTVARNNDLTLDQGTGQRMGTYTACPTTGILREFGVVGGNNLNSFAYNSAVFARRLGLPRSEAILAEMGRRMTEGNGGVPFRKADKGYPAAAFGYVA